MLIRCTNGDILNPQKMELFTIIENDGAFFISGICHGQRYDIIYTNNRSEAESILFDLYKRLSVGMQRAESIDFKEYLKNNRWRNGRSQS